MPFYSPNIALYQCKIFLPVSSMLLFCTYLTAPLSGVGHALYLDITPQNHWQPRWNYLGVWSSIHSLELLLDWGIICNSYYLWEYIHPPLLLVQICKHCVPFPLGCIGLQTLVGSLISVSLCILFYPSYCSGKNPLDPCTCILIWCLRCHYWHVVSLWLTLMWLWWILLDII